MPVKYTWFQKKLIAWAESAPPPKRVEHGHLHQTPTPAPPPGPTRLDRALAAAGRGTVAAAKAAGALGAALAIEYVKARIAKRYTSPGTLESIERAEDLGERLPRPPTTATHGTPAPRPLGDPTVREMLRQRRFPPR